MAFLEENRAFTDVPTIPDFYEGKTIFITGGSGFMGKVLVEKLLYSCSDLKKIYLLIRCKKNVQPEDRINDLYSSPCFDRLREEKPNIFSSKVAVIPGDVTQLGLGISNENREILVNTVNIIFHVAASVRFDDPLTVAVKMNLQGTKEVIHLAQETKDLCAHIHVSTSYSNTNRNPIEEVMYPPHADWRDVMQICEEMDEHVLRTLTPKMMGEIPNTYSFTKQLAEHVVYEQNGKIPLVIYRPSIVISSVNEPVKGYIENFNGPVGLLIASGKGIMRSVYSNPDLIADYMPVDVAIRAMIAAAWMRGTKKLEATDDIPIYNCCSGNLNNVSMAEILDMGKEVIKTAPIDNMLWNIGGSITTSPLKHYIKVILLHLLPAIFIDTLLKVMGKKPMLVKIQRRIYIANKAVSYYLNSQWNFDNKNFISLRSRIKEQDKKQFYYDIENVDRMEFFLNATLGGKKYLLKEKEEDLPKARAHYKRIVAIEFVVHCIFYGFLTWWILNLNCVQNTLHNLVG